MQEEPTGEDKEIGALLELFPHHNPFIRAVLITENEIKPQNQEEKEKAHLSTEFFKGVYLSSLMYKTDSLEDIKQWLDHFTQIRLDYTPRHVAAIAYLVNKATTFFDNKYNDDDPIQKILYNAFDDDIVEANIPLKEFFEKTRFLPVPDLAQEPFKAVCQEYLKTQALTFSNTIYRDYGDLFSTDDIAKNFMNNDEKMEGLKDYILTYLVGD